jgi:hypothetical protein
MLQDYIGNFIGEVANYDMRGYSGLSVATHPSETWDKAQNLELREMLRKSEVENLEKNKGWGRS